MELEMNTTKKADSLNSRIGSDTRCQDYPSYGAMVNIGHADLLPRLAPKAPKSRFLKQVHGARLDQRTEIHARTNGNG